MDVVLLKHQYGFRPFWGRVLSLSILQHLIESSRSAKSGLRTIYIDLEQCFDRSAASYGVPYVRVAYRSRSSNFFGTYTLTPAVEFVPKTNLALVPKWPVALAKAPLKDQFGEILYGSHGAGSPTSAPKPADCVPIPL